MMSRDYLSCPGIEIWYYELYSLLFIAKKHSFTKEVRMNATLSILPTPSTSPIKDIEGYCRISIWLDVGIWLEFNVLTSNFIWLDAQLLDEIPWYPAIILYNLKIDYFFNLKFKLYLLECLKLFPRFCQHIFTSLMLKPNLLKHSTTKVLLPTAKVQLNSRLLTYSPSSSSS